MKLYSELADWWHLLSRPEDYEEEARVFVHTILTHARRDVRTVLELGSGGGNNASHMKHRFEMTLTDLSPRMLDQSRRLNPECEHVQGDMRTVRLGRTFDAVFVHDAVSYMISEADLVAAITTASEHLGPGGLALFVPDATAESFRPATSSGGHDDGIRSLRYLHWEHPPEPGQATHEVTFVYVLHEGDEERVETEQHTVGLFGRTTWLACLEHAGFEATALPYRHSSFAPDAGHEMFLGIKA